jgi:tetratricopeptide (TPR) repeat protein
MRRTLLLTLILACQVATSPAARAQDADSAQVERAENYAAAAYDAYQRKDYTAAVALYRKALEASPSADITYNLARIYDTKLKNRTRAIEYYGRYVADPGGEPSRVQASMERLLVLREQQRIASGETLPPPAAQNGAQPAPPAPETGLTAMQIAGTLVGAVGIAAVATGAVFGFIAKSKAETAHTWCDGDQCRSQRGVDAAHRASDMALVSTSAFIAGGSLIVGGVALLVFGGRSERQVSALTERPEHYSAWVDRHGFGVQLAGQF